MLWFILKREILDHLMRLQFALGFLLLVSLFLTNSLLFVKGYPRDAEEYQHVAQKNTEGLRDNANHLNYLAISPQRVRMRPSVLSFCAKGWEKDVIPMVAVVNAFRIRDVEPKTDIPIFLERFKELDWVFIIGVVASLVALVLTYDGISGEKETGTLRAMMANPVPRTEVIVGKYLAGLLCLAIPVVIGMLLNVIIIGLSRDVSLGGKDLARIGLMGVISLMYLSLFVWVGLFVSSKTATPAVSLLVLLVVWTVVVVFIPGGGALVASKLYEMPTRRQIAEEVRLLGEELQRKYKEVTYLRRRRTMRILPL